MSALPNTACTTNGSLLTSGTGTAQLSVASGKVTLADAVTHGGTMAVFSLKNLVIANTTGDAIHIEGSNYGLYIRSSGGDAVNIQSSGNNAVTLQSSNASGIKIITFDGIGVKIDASGGNAIYAKSSNDNAIYVQSNTGDSIHLVNSLGVGINGTLSTVTNLTNLPSIPANWLTAAGINAGALNGKGDWLTPAGTLAHVTLVDTVTTYTGNTPQTGDTFAVVNSGTFGNAAIKGDTGTILTDVNSGAGAIYTRIGAPVGASISADIASVKSSVGTVTNLTNLPSIPANWLTAAGINAGALNGKGDWLLASGYTAPDNSDITAIKTQTDKLTFSGANILSQLADAVTHGGSTAFLALQNIDINNSIGNGVNITSSTALGIAIEGSVGIGITAANNGLQIFSGANAIDLYATGNAIYAQSTANDCVLLYAGPNNIGIHVYGGTTLGDAVRLYSAQGHALGLVSNINDAICISANNGQGIRLSSTGNAINIVSTTGHSVNMYNPLGYGINGTLSPSSLDQIAITAPTGPASNFREMMVQTWRRLFKKSVKDKDALTIKTYADNGTTIITTQDYTDDGVGNETLGSAS